MSTHSQKWRIYDKLAEMVAFEADTEKAILIAWDKAPETLRPSLVLLKPGEAEPVR